MRTIDLKKNEEFKTKIWDDDRSCKQHQKRFSVLEQQQILAEIAYVLQPLVHLTSMATLGPKSWAPWMLSFGCDLLRYGFTFVMVLSTRPQEGTKVSGSEKGRERERAGAKKGGSEKGRERKRAGAEKSVGRKERERKRVGENKSGSK